jgi:hypothetical protein
MTLDESTGEGVELVHVAVVSHTTGPSAATVARSPSTVGWSVIGFGGQVDRSP